MMLTFLETGRALYVLTAVCVLGLLSRWTARGLYKRLIRETDNMTMTKNRWLRDFRQKAENAYRLNQGIQNTQAYLEKQLFGCRFLDSGKFVLVIVYGKVDPAQKIVACPGLGKQHVFGAQHRRLHILDFFRRNKTGCFGIVKCYFFSHTFLLLLSLGARYGTA